MNSPTSYENTGGMISFRQVIPETERQEEGQLIEMTETFTDRHLMEQPSTETHINLKQLFYKPQ